MSSSYKIQAVILIVTILILKAYSRRGSFAEARPNAYQDTKTKWMDVWSGNKSTIDVLFRDFGDIMYKLTSRRVRSPLRFRSENEKNSTETHQPPAKRVSRVEINFINPDNSTFHMIRHEPMKQIVNNTIIKDFESLPLLGMK